MTISEGCSKLFAWFAANEKFEMDKDYQSLVLIAEDEECERGTIRVSLKKLEEINIISKIPIEKRDLWVLEKPLSSYEQTVSVDGNMAEQISKIINTTCTAIGDYQDVCTPLDITSKDINNLIFICQKLYDHDSEKNFLDNESSD